MWNELSATFKLKSPLYIGYLPSGASIISPTRYYVPGRNFWGALTRKITELRFVNPTGKDYLKIGRDVMENFRFSYFYVYDGKKVYMPEYRDDGLKYGDMGIHDFEGRFISSTISTAIMDGLAVDGTLHEIEYINSRFSDGENVNNTLITGCIWVKDDAPSYLEIEEDGILLDENNILDELILGGESKYGFGHVILDSFNDKRRIPLDVELSTDIIISDRFLKGHMKYSDDFRFMGDVELISGRGYIDPETGKRNGRPGGIILKPEYYLSPGTFIEDESSLILSWDGTLKQLES